jgi:hypothetical protein
MIKFTTESGTVYYLKGSKLKREGVKPLKDIYRNFEPMDHDPDWEHIEFQDEPKIGESFMYYHPTLYGCYSTPVVSIEEVD